MNWQLTDHLDNWLTRYVIDQVKKGQTFTDFSNGRIFCFHDCNDELYIFGFRIIDWTQQATCVEIVGSSALW